MRAKSLAIVLGTLWASPLLAEESLTAEDVRAIVDARILEIEAAHEQRLREMGWTASATTTAPPDGTQGKATPLPVLVDPKNGRFADSQGVMAGVGQSTLDRDVSAGKRAELSAGSDGSRASIRAVWDHSHRWAGAANFSSTSVNASAPLDKGGSGQTSLASLDALSNGFELGVNFSRFRMRGQLSPFDRDGALYPRVREICKYSGAKQCDDDQIAAGLEAKGEHALLAEFLGYFQRADSTDSIWGLKAKVGQSTFDYFELPTLQKRDETELPWSAGAYYALVSRTRRTLYSFGVDYQESYKASSTATACPLPDYVTHLQCVTGSLAGPGKKEKHLASVEMRHQFEGGTWFPDGVGMSLKFTRDFNNNESGVDLPLYLFRSDKGFLTGGIRAGWTDTDQFNGGVFVGTDFGVLP